ncbi:MAG: hypothetical protein ACREHG_11490, partial [Candidatus Saccharimonadales bacterium]
NNSASLVIVRNAVDPEFCDQLIGTGQNSQEAVYAEIPELEILSKVVNNWWQNHGFSDYQISDRVELSMSSGISPNRNFKPHVDGPVIFGAGVCYLGGITVSLASGSKDAFANYSVSKPRNPCQPTWSRHFDEAKYKTMRGRAGLAGRFVPFQATARQNPGDAVIFTQLPWPSRHKVESFNGRRARLLDFPLYPPLQARRRPR